VDFKRGRRWVAGILVVLVTFIAGPAIVRTIRSRLIPRKSYRLVITAPDGDAQTDARRLQERFARMEAIVESASTAPGRIEMKLAIPLQQSLDPYQAGLLQRAHLSIQLADADGQRLEEPEILTNRHVTDVRVAFDNSEPYVQVSLSKEGATRFEEFTSKNVGRFVAVALDGKIEMAAKLTQPISGGIVAIHLGGSEPIPEKLNRAKNLSLMLQAGDLTGTWTAVSLTPLQ
jgi:preprotein translocase subunit SecD